MAGAAAEKGSSWGEAGFLHFMIGRDGAAVDIS
jgi:hypothetical protein